MTTTEVGQGESVVMTVSGGEWVGLYSDAVRAGAEQVNAQRLEGGSYAHYADETSAWYRVTEAELAELGASHLLGERDVYSRWSQESGEEIDDLDHDALDEVSAVTDAPVRYRCQCGTATGQRCEWTGPREQLAHVKWVPDSDRGSAQASGTYTRGAYAKSIYVEADTCAPMLAHVYEDGEPTEKEDPYVRVVGPAYEQTLQPPEIDAGCSHCEAEAASLDTSGDE